MSFLERKGIYIKMVNLEVIIKYLAIFMTILIGITLIIMSLSEKKDPLRKFLGCFMGIICFLIAYTMLYT